MDNINVVYMDMPIGCKEAVTPNEDDSYTIFINTRYSQEQRTASYLHALGHIEHEDFNNECSVDTIEAKAHQ